MWFLLRILKLKVGNSHFMSHIICRQSDCQKERNRRNVCLLLESVRPLCQTARECRWTFASSASWWSRAIGCAWSWGAFRTRPRQIAASWTRHRWTSSLRPRSAQRRRRTAPSPISTRPAVQCRRRQTAPETDSVWLHYSRLNIKHLIMLRKTKLCRHLFLAHNNLLRDMFSVFLLHNSDNDPILKTVFWTASVAVDYVWTLFQSYVNL